MNTFIEPTGRKGIQEIIWNYIWWGICTFIDPSGRKCNKKMELHLMVGSAFTVTPLEEKVTEKLYEPTSGGGEVPLLTPSEEKVNKKLHETTSGGGWPPWKKRYPRNYMKLHLQGVCTFINPSARKGDQKILIFRRKVTKKSYEITSGGGVNIFVDPSTKYSFIWFFGFPFFGRGQ